MTDYGGLITLHGQADLASAAGGGPALTFTHIAVGDGGGVSYDPVENQAALANERGRYAVTSVAVQPDGRIVATAVIPANQGGWHIREAGLITSANRLFMVAKYPPAFKPAAGSGGAIELTIAMIVDIGNAPPAAINVTVQPSAKVAWSRHGRAPFIAVDDITDTAPANPDEGTLLAVLNSPAPQGVLGGRGGQLAEFIEGAWTFTPVAKTTIVRLPDGSFRQRVGFADAASFWQVYVPNPAHTHTVAQITDYYPAGDARWLRKDAGDQVAMANAWHQFQNLRIGPDVQNNASRNFSFRQHGDNFDRLVIGRVGTILAFNALDGATGAYLRTHMTLGDAGDLTLTGPNARLVIVHGDDASRSAILQADGGSIRLNASGPGGGGRLLLAHDGSVQQILRAGVWRQIATENRQIGAGAGLTGGGDLSADRTLAVDAAWLDNRIADRNAVRKTAQVYATAEAQVPIQIDGLSSTNGLQVASLSYAPAAADSRLLIRCDVMLEPRLMTNGVYMRAALFDGAAIIAAYGVPGAANSAENPFGQFSFVFEGAAGSTAARTYSLRIAGVGAFAGGNLITLNPSHMGTPRSGFSILELKP